MSTNNFDGSIDKTRTFLFRIFSVVQFYEILKVYQYYSTKKRAVPRSIETPAMDDRLDRSSSSTSGIGRSASKSTNSARSSTNSFSDTDLEYGTTITERSLAKTNQENGVIFELT